MKEIQIVCQVCPNGCQITAEAEDGEVVDVTGNGCMKGYIYAQREVLKLQETEAGE